MSTTAARNRFKEFIKSDLWIIMLDIAAVNLAYFLALIMRFYVNNEFRSSVSFYLTYFARYAPVYTVLCLIVFALCRLYGGMWRYAGINDMNRIILANLCTMVLHVAVSILCIRLMPEAARSRMPISLHSAVYSAILAAFSSTLDMRAAIYSRG